MWIYVRLVDLNQTKMEIVVYNLRQLSTEAPSSKCQQRGSTDTRDQWSEILHFPGSG